MFAKPLLVALLAGTVAVLLIVPASAKTKVDAELMKSLDPYGKGTVDLSSVKTAATAEFNKLDKDHNGKLDAKELKGVMKKGAIKKADPDKDGTLDLNEYTALVEKEFKAADPDKDGTLSEAELKSKKGQKLLKLI